jgi:hypothetical protein
MDTFRRLALISGLEEQVRCGGAIMGELNDFEQELEQQISLHSALTWFFRHSELKPRRSG